MHIPRPVSRQAQHPSPQTPIHSNPSLSLQENGNSTMMPQPHILTKSRPASRSTVSLVPVKRVAPPVEDSPRQARRRVQSFSNQKQPVMSKANSSWPQISAARHVEQQLSRSPIKRRILFYHKHQPYYGFTNFSSHPVKYKGKQYPTSEHLFQSFKFQEHRPGLAEHIRLCCPGPTDALSESRRFRPEVRPDWMKVNVDKMDETLWYKFNQHPALRAELLATGDAELIEDSDKDSFWGVGADRRGRNELGKALERLREKLCRR